MSRTRGGATIVALALGALLALAAAPRDQPASAAASSAAGVAATSTHRAAVVVDLGDGQVKVGCVSFTQDHISGLEALDRASMAPVAQTFGGQGGAVCALCGKGCSAGSTCLTCKAPNYWAYYHDGTYSSIGASRSQVHDGDIEGWKWGKGERPTNVPFDKVCLPSSGPKPTPSPTTRPAVPIGPTTTPTTQAPVGGSGGSGGTTAPLPRTDSIPLSTPGHSATTGASPTTTPTAPSAPAPASTAPPAPPGSTATTAGTGPKATVAGSGKKSAVKGSTSALGRKHVVIERAGATTDSSPVGAGKTSSGSQSSAWSIATFAAAIATVAALIGVLRRRRAHVQ